MPCRTAESDLPRHFSVPPKTPAANGATSSARPGSAADSPSTGSTGSTISTRATSPSAVSHELLGEQLQKSRPNQKALGNLPVPEGTGVTPCLRQVQVTQVPKSQGKSRFGRHLKTDEVSRPTSPRPRSPKAKVDEKLGEMRPGEVFHEKMDEEEDEAPYSAWMPTRFANVRREGRSSTPPRREKDQSWRPDHIPVTCVIKRSRHRKGPKEKLLLLPFSANQEDPRFRHLWETLDAEQDLMSEQLNHLQRFVSVRY